MSNSIEGFFSSGMNYDKEIGIGTKAKSTKKQQKQTGYFSFQEEEDDSNSINQINLTVNQEQQQMIQEHNNEQLVDTEKTIKEENMLQNECLNNNKCQKGLNGINDITNQSKNMNSLDLLVSPPLKIVKKKREFNLFLPVDIISKAEKEAPFPTDGNSQKKTQDVFNFYDNFHEYTVFCDVSMKKCSRKNQEDRFSAISPLDTCHNCDAFFAVFDGHSTSVIADTLKENLHTYISKNENYPRDIQTAVKQSFQKIDDEILKQQQENLMVSGGSTALCCLINEDKLYVINCGDSSSILVKDDYSVQVLNNLHKPSSREEAERLQQKNTLFTEERVFGTLAITRALGDYKLKDYIISEPEIKVFTIDESFKYCLLGTDGFWDIIDYQKDLPDLLKKRDCQFEGERSNLKDLSNYLVEAASNRTTQSKKDNMTLLAIDLNWFYRQKSEMIQSEEVISNEEKVLSNGSNSIMCQLNCSKEISSFLLQARSPLSINRTHEKRQTITKSLNHTKFIQQEEERPKTSSKQKPGKRVFFSSDNSVEDDHGIHQATSIFYISSADNPDCNEMEKLDGAILASKGTAEFFNDRQDQMTTSQSITGSINLSKIPDSIHPIEKEEENQPTKKKSNFFTF